MNKQFKVVAATVFFITTAWFSHAEIAFSGFAGAKADFYSSDTSDFDPALNFQSFFSGQLSFNKNVILNAEFSLQTEDIIENSFYEEVQSNFKIDEISLILRQQFLSVTNYISAFAGTYEPIGSDIFLRRQFGIPAIASKITESWLGLAGSIIYPMFGVGGAEIIHFNTVPLVTGVYIYVNHELEDSYVINADYRFAGHFRYFTFDLSGGVGLPLIDDSDNSYFRIDTVYGRAGANILIGNTYTTSLFIQAGISEIKIKKKNNKLDFNEDSAYLLFEPRFRGKKLQAHITLFNIPQNSVNDFIFINDTVGANLNIFTDTIVVKNKTMTFGINSALSFPDKNINDLISEPDKIMDDYNINIAPYFTTSFYNGEVHFMSQFKISEIIDSNFGSAFKFNLGYKTQF